MKQTPQMRSLAGSQLTTDHQNDIRQTSPSDPHSIPTFSPLQHYHSGRKQKQSAPNDDEIVGFVPKDELTVKKIES